MAETRDLSEIVDALRETTRLTERRALRRLVLTATLALAAAGYMSWLHSQLSRLDAQAVTDIARGEIEARLPELGERLSQMAIDAAPEVMDRGEEALMSAPATLRASLEQRMSATTDDVLTDVADRLDAELDAFVVPRLAQVAEAGTPPLDDLIDEVRGQYREKASALASELYVAYAREIGGVNDYLVHLRDEAPLTRRERIEKEILEASVALRRHYVRPIEPVGVASDDETAER